MAGIQETCPECHFNFRRAVVMAGSRNQIVRVCACDRLPCNVCRAPLSPLATRCGACGAWQPPGSTVGLVR